MKKRKWLILVKANKEGQILRKELFYTKEGWSGTPSKDDPKVGNSVVWYEPTRWWKHGEFRAQVFGRPFLPISRLWRRMTIENKIAVIATCISAIAAITSLYALISCAC